MLVMLSNERHNFAPIWVVGAIQFSKYFVLLHPPTIHLVVIFLNQICSLSHKTSPVWNTGSSCSGTMSHPVFHPCPVKLGHQPSWWDFDLVWKKQRMRRIFPVCYKHGVSFSMPVSSCLANSSMSGVVFKLTRAVNLLSNNFLTGFLDNLFPGKDIEGNERKISCWSR